MPWRPGKSGNPGGRPKGSLAAVARIARQHTEEAMEVLASIMRDDGEQASARVSAAKELLDRAWGKAPQELLITDENPAIDMSDDELTDEIATEIARMTAKATKNLTQH